MIDYGNGMTNIDFKTGIRYGVISQNEVLQAWADSSEPHYPCDICEMPESERETGACGNCETTSFVLDDGEYVAECGESGDIFITHSPYFTYCAFCSPCAPGAGYLKAAMDPEAGIKAYCFGPEWFDEALPPYKVYKVETGEEVVDDRDREEA